ncbi:ABC transporter ATP-binding protein [Marinithermofilum abyssi]|uniref:ABC transporter ATP-binding protein n=1 Tax=Marinithermofilum abyssi TaxID=1571185 RepID=A0A8J2VDU0_9BACL|nr:ABC transporter ATP-binding protein [Marinithermofilum abyssi]GGE18504.1 ABC transporter ATP-binding protein [Marinithermofilum abyssi]
MLEVHQLTGGYFPQQPVIHDLSFHVQPKEIVCLIGLNGAGKSTTIKHILGFLRPTKGTILFDGQTQLDHPESFRKKIAYIPETPYLYPELTLKEHLQLTAMAYGIKKKHAEGRMEELMETFQMTRQADWYPSTFSKGMRQKVMIMCAFLIQPRLLIVDEPFVGLDPLAIHSLLEHMVQLKEQGCSILLSTHVLATAEKYGDRFVILKEGRIALQGDMASMRQQTGLDQASLDQLFVHVMKEGRP